MQNATIQINAMSGMGDIFCDIHIAVIIANAFKKEDCNTDLKFYWGPHPVDNKKIFDDSFFDNFNSVETIDKPIVLHFSGGLDTGVILSVINKYKLPIDIKMDNQGKVLLSTPDQQSPNFRSFANSKDKFPGFGFAQIPLENNRWLVSGHYGGIETLRFPQHVKSVFRHYELDYNEELQKNVGSYLYNFLQCADHNCDTTYPLFEFTDLVKAKCHILDAIKYNMEIQTIENNLLVLPWRQVEIPVAMLNLNINDFKEHVFHSTVHKKIIEMNDNKINNIIPTQKEKEIW